jgi:four helix bundle protein
MKDNVVQRKSYLFSVRIVKLYKMLIEEKNAYAIGKQILRSGTSIGANIEEGIGGQSKADFVSKMNIAYKEARETVYWIRLLRDTYYVEPKLAESFLNDCEEIQKLLSSILITSISKS